MPCQFVFVELPYVTCNLAVQSPFVTESQFPQTEQYRRLCCLESKFVFVLWRPLRLKLGHLEVLAWGLKGWKRGRSIFRWYRLPDAVFHWHCQLSALQPTLAVSTAPDGTRWVAAHCRITWPAHLSERFGGFRVYIPFAFDLGTAIQQSLRLVPFRALTVAFWWLFCHTWFAPRVSVTVFIPKPFFPCWGLVHLHVCIIGTWYRPDRPCHSSGGKSQVSP